MAGNHSATAHHASHDDHGGHHVVPASVLTKVLLFLLAMTVLTVVTAKFMHLGAAAVPVAFAIALCKALMVMGFFMGLKYDSKGNVLIFATGFVGLALLFFFCALDTFSRVFQGNAL